MNTIICACLLLCVSVAYGASLPGSDLSPAPVADEKVAVKAPDSQDPESLDGQESHWGGGYGGGYGGYGGGYGGYGGGYGHGYGGYSGGYGGYGGWGYGGGHRHGGWGGYGGHGGWGGYGWGR